MSRPANSYHPPGRNRADEPAERHRAALQAAKRCITPGCGRPATGQRCPDCRARIEANTGRYRGHGHQGPPTKLESDVLDLRLAAEAVGRAYAGFAEAKRLALPPRQQADHLAEWLAQAHLAERHLRDVQRRHRPARLRPPARPHPQLAFAFWYMGAR